MTVNITAEMALLPDDPRNSPEAIMSIIERVNLPKMLDYLTATGHAKTMIASLNDSDGKSVGDIVISIRLR